MLTFVSVPWLKWTLHLPPWFLWELLIWQTGHICVFSVMQSVSDKSRRASVSLEQVFVCTVGEAWHEGDLILHFSDIFNFCAVAWSSHEQWSVSPFLDLYVIVLSYLWLLMLTAIYTGLHTSSLISVYILPSAGQTELCSHCHKSQKIILTNKICVHDISY